MGEAIPYLNYLGAGHCARKLSEIGIGLTNSSDNQQRSNAYGVWEVVIHELEDANRGSHTTPGGGTNQIGDMSKNGQRGIMDMSDTMNQWNETKMKSLLNHIQKNMVDPRDKKIREKDRQIENQQREIRHLKRINEISAPNRIDIPTNLDVVREAEVLPRQTSQIIGDGGFGFLKPTLDMTPTRRRGISKEEVQYNILAEDRALSDNSFNEE